MRSYKGPLTRHGRSRKRLIATALLLLPLLFGVAREQNLASAQDTGRYYPQTGYTLAAQFVQYFDAHGAIPVFGYPIGPAHQEKGYLVQWTERERLEYHPENAGTEYEVQLGLLGSELTRGFDGPSFARQIQEQGQPSGATTPDGSQVLPAVVEAPLYFAQTGHEVAGHFLDYWQKHGGIEIFGYPVSGAYTDDTGLEIQWFERARFEYHPELQSSDKVLLGQLGREASAARSDASYILSVYDQPAPDSGLAIDLSEGGESDDPTFLANVRDQGMALKTDLVRIDNIFNFYHVVSRNADGTLQYSWAELDTAIDNIRAMGKDPLLCLSYMPELMSMNGDSRVTRPASFDDWAALVHAMVLHLNAERGLGIKYFEVWNEPDQWSFWQASFQDYMELYDVTVQAITSVTPDARIGGPAAGRFSPVHFQVFLAHEASLGALGRVDFLSWHDYGQTPEELAAHIREIRALAAQYPQFNPELFITEFNVMQGGSGDTSASGRTDTADGAIALLTSIESMQRERLNRAFLFELKDGPGPTDFWGRWGILTNSGQPKPIYWALKAYLERPAGMLPVVATRAPDDGTVGMMAFGGPTKATLMLWYAGSVPAQVKVTLPASFNETTFNLTLFDKDHNNPARTGDARLSVWAQRNARDLVVNLQPGSLLLMATP